jgi:hypothetical protein
MHVSRLTARALGYLRSRLLDLEGTHPNAGPAVAPRCSRLDCYRHPGRLVQQSRRVGDQSVGLCNACRFMSASRGRYGRVHDSPSEKALRRLLAW